MQTRPIFGNSTRRSHGLAVVLFYPRIGQTRQHVKLSQECYAWFTGSKMSKRLFWYEIRHSHFGSRNLDQSLISRFYCCQAILRWNSKMARPNLSGDRRLNDHLNPVFIHKLCRKGIRSACRFVGCLVRQPARRCEPHLACASIAVEVSAV